MSEDRVVIGRVVKAHGLRGEVSVHVLSDVDGRFTEGDHVHLDGTPTTIASSRPHQGRLLVRFDGVSDRNAAELLRGQVIEAPAADLADLDTYFVHELVGMAVVTPDGDHLGDVSDHVELPSAAGYDLLEITREDGTTWLLPAVDDYVEVGELPDGTELLVVVDPPDGLVTGEPEVVRADGGEASPPPPLDASPPTPSDASPPTPSDASPPTPSDASPPTPPTPPEG